jgi:hypothetical protein
MIKKVGLFLGGLVVGVTATVIYFRKNFEYVAPETNDTDDVEEMLNVKNTTIEEKVIELPKKPLYNKVIKNYQGVNSKDHIYPIEDDEFGEEDEYDTDCLMYTSDGILTSPDGDINEEIQKYVDMNGAFVNTDTVYVRNSVLKIDYEIVSDNRDYNSLFGTGPEEE